MQIERVIRYSRADAQSAPGTLFVFGDNMERRGLKGQAAALRGEPNAVGIITKNRPAYEDDAYLNDTLHDKVCAASWEADFDRLTKQISAGGRVVWPADGIGTDLAQMKQRAPLLWEELCLRTRELFKLAGQENDLIIIGAGGRDYADPVQIEIAFGHVGQRFRIAELIEGGAAGADTLCGLQADRSAIPRRTVPADWNGFAAAGNRNGAGPARNRQMAEMLLARREQTGCRIGLLVLPGGRGTENMIQTAESLGIKPMPIKQRAGHAEGIAAALAACNRGIKDMRTRGDLTKGIIEAYAEHGMPSFAGDIVKAQEAAVLTCVRVTKNADRQPKPEYLVRDVVSSFLGSLIETRIVTAPTPPQNHLAEAHP